MNSQIKATLRIFNFAGQLIYENPQFYGQEIIDLEGYKRGIFYVSVLTETQGVYTGKLIKL